MRGLPYPELPGWKEAKPGFKPVRPRLLGTDILYLSTPQKDVCPSQGMNRDLKQVSQTVSFSNMEITIVPLTDDSRVSDSIVVLGANVALA